MKPFPFYHQLDAMDCGPTCLRMIASHYGNNISLEVLRNFCEIGKEGVSVLGLSNAAEKIGFRTQAVKISISQLQDTQLPVLLHWRQNHFVVLYKVGKPFTNKFTKNRQTSYHIADPASGIFKMDEEKFRQNWIITMANNEAIGFALLMEPTPAFFNNKHNNGKSSSSAKNIGTILKYVYPYKKLIFQLLLGLLIGSLLQLMLPFLTQSVVDTGINNGNIGFVRLVLFAQLALLTGRLLNEFIRGWILYHISSRVNISILTDFIIKLMKLPISFFDSKKTGDIMQRMGDHNRIQNFLTGSSLNTLFSVFNLLVFSAVLIVYNLPIFGVFLIASLLYFIWIFLFLKKRKQLDYKQFDIASAEQGKIIQLVLGMTEIKLQGCESSKRWEWERLQAKTFKLGLKGWP